MEKVINVEVKCSGIEETLEKANLLKETLLEANQLADSLHEKTFKLDHVLTAFNNKQMLLDGKPIF
jgi:hypothetical protein